MFRSADKFEVPPWEKEVGFDPSSNVKEVRKEEKWADLRDFGFVGEDPRRTMSHPSAEEVWKSDVPFSITDLPIRDPRHFISGSLCHHATKWEEIIDHEFDGEADKILSWIENGVDVNDFFKHFRDTFRGEQFNSLVPTSCYFENSDSCRQMGADVIIKTLYDRLASGSVKLLGKLGECDMPRLILPLIVEPAKKRLCLDARFLNLWTKDSRIDLNTLRDVPRMVNRGTYMIKTDEKSGYFHVKLTPSSQTFFGFQFGGYAMVCTTLPFGWKASPFVYQSIGARVTSYLRSMSIRNSLYIDDRIAVSSQAGLWGLAEARKIAYVILELLTRLGYTLSVSKLCLEPKQRMKYLGVEIDSLAQMFLFSNEKGKHFENLLEKITTSPEKVDVRLIRKFLNTCLTHLHVLSAFKLILRLLPGNRKNKVNVRRLTNKLRGRSHDLKLFLKNCELSSEWVNSSKWLPEYSIRVDLCMDASCYRYRVDGQETHRSWPNTEAVSKRDYAIGETVVSLAERIRNSRVYIYLDDRIPVDSRPRRNRVFDLKDVIKLVTKYNIDLNIRRTFTSDSPGKLYNQHTMLSEKSWRRIEEKYGPHTLDLMALDCNCMRSKNGDLLKHFTPYPSKESSGVNVFCQQLSSRDNPYAFPVRGLIFPLLRLLKEQKVDCTIVVPDKRPFPPWWPLLESASISSFVLGRKAETGILKIPQGLDFVLDDKGLEYPLLVHRVAFSDRNLSKDTHTNNPLLATGKKR